MNQAMLAALAAVDAAKDQLGIALDQLADVMVSGSSITVPLPAADAPVAPKYEFDEQGLLKGYKPGVGGRSRVDPVVGRDCPRTVYMPVTGHVLSEPRPDLGEMFLGYAMRVAEQAGATEVQQKAIGALLIGVSKLGDASDPKNWPAMADKFYNRRAYMTPEEREKADKEAEGWNAAKDRMRGGGSSDVPIANG